MEYAEEEFENLDTDWIEEYNNVEELYLDLYKEQVETLPIYFLYVNRDSDLFHISKEILDLSGSTLTKTNIISLLKTNMVLNKKKYRPISILKYNLTISPQDVENYIENNIDTIQDVVFGGIDIFSKNKLNIKKLSRVVSRTNALRYWKLFVLQSYLDSL